MPCSRGGAIPAVLLLLLALTGLAYGVLGLAISELRTVSANRHLARAMLGAKAGAVRGFQSLDSLLLDTVRLRNGAIAGGETPEGILYAADFRWLGSEYFLLEATGGSSGWPGRRQIGWIGWALDPIARVDALGAGMSTGGPLEVGPASTIAVSVADTDALGWPADACLPFKPALDSLYRDRDLPLWAPIPVLDTGKTEESDVPGIGLLTGAEVLARAADEGNPLPSSSATPGGLCMEGGGRALWFSEGSASFGEGEWCGVVAVAGDLTLGQGVHLQGLALVGGNLLLEEGGRFDGMARVAGAAIVADGSELLISACVATAVLSTTAPLLRPALLPDGYRVNGF
jgi:hypothetical protein